MYGIVTQRCLASSRRSNNVIFGLSRFSTRQCLRALARSPKVENIEQRRKQEATQTLRFSNASAPPKKTAAVQEWPNYIFDAAKEHGALSVSSKTAEAILNDFQKLRSTSGSIKDFCLKHRIELSVLSELGRALLMARTEATYAIAQDLLISASSLQDPNATLILIDQGIRTGKLGSIAFDQPRKHLQSLVSARNPVALYLQGRIYESQGKKTRALEAFVESTKVSSDPSLSEGAGNMCINLANPLKAVARLSVQKGDLEAAKEALKKAAFEYDDPLAYVWLALRFSDSSSNQSEIYLLKAASSGNAKAIQYLGKLYYQQLQNREFPRSGETASEDSPAAILEDLLTDEPGNSDDPLPFHEAPLFNTVTKDQKDTATFGIELWASAYEWLSLGAEINIPASKARLASLLKQVGQPAQLPITKELIARIDKDQKATTDPPGAATIA